MSYDHRTCPMIVGHVANGAFTGSFFSNTKSGPVFPVKTFPPPFFLLPFFLPLHFYPWLYVSYQQQCFYLTADMPRTSFTFTFSLTVFFVCVFCFFCFFFFSYFERRCREVVRLSIPPKAAYFEGRCREVVRLSIPPKAAYFEGRCRGLSV